MFSPVNNVEPHLCLPQRLTEEEDPSKKKKKRNPRSDKHKQDELLQLKPDETVTGSKCSKSKTFGRIRSSSKRRDLLANDEKKKRDQRKEEKMTAQSLDQLDSLSLKELAGDKNKTASRESSRKNIHKENVDNQAELRKSVSGAVTKILEEKSSLSTAMKLISKTPGKKRGAAQTPARQGASAPPGEGAKAQPARSGLSLLRQGSSRLASLCTVKDTDAARGDMCTVTRAATQAEAPSTPAPSPPREAARPPACPPCDTPAADAAVREVPPGEPRVKAPPADAPAQASPADVPPLQSDDAPRAPPPPLENVSIRLADSADGLCVFAPPGPPDSPRPFSPDAHAADEGCTPDVRGSRSAVPRVLAHSASDHCLDSPTAGGGGCPGVSQGAPARPGTSSSMPALHALPLQALQVQTLTAERDRLRSQCRALSLKVDSLKKELEEKDEAIAELNSQLLATSPHSSDSRTKFIERRISRIHHSLCSIRRIRLTRKVSTLIARLPFRGDSPSDEDTGDNVFNIRHNGDTSHSHDAALSPMRTTHMDNMTYENLFQLEDVPHGIPEEMLEHIPRSKWRPPIDPGERIELGEALLCEAKKQKCVICLCKFRMGEDVATLPCVHSFHADCICPWLRLKKTCPVCKEFCV
mmetsp:Transcript_16029/g.41158  ORF Transcript_16029/g.41158 Transcript_16029/m.41158 type:complete len:641 (+) Transcript_16029:213-2135(+)|eukprot:CAMPEP_0177646666 /NCGR_PEP_ID=MMETSP0447-20121125/9891_1 /TAXON_ID=0 /ORGANISM="Stygamoeba regulata, Strain BSH-02190019" /LENGTH=640 /DNA_ID=CAMNT_0019149205 /DNA_START=329 /DNA_END=2251 /DNA_ORIENTATION=-